MELRRVDPRMLKANAHNPRKIQPGELSDAALAASINVVGILQPPTVSEKDGALTIVYGARRVRVAIRSASPRSTSWSKTPTTTIRCGR
jgi:ParB-like chromosome segregation protein Spo0J